MHRFYWIRAASVEELVAELNAIDKKKLPFDIISIVRQDDVSVAVIEVDQGYDTVEEEQVFLPAMTA